jgi:acyl-coenzyme A thioesterase PaaI-like protein
MMVHGGPLASLVDTSAAAAARSAGEIPANVRASTVGMTVNYLAGLTVRTPQHQAVPQSGGKLG